MHLASETLSQFSRESKVDAKSIDQALRVFTWRLAQGQSLTAEIFEEIVMLILILILKQLLWTDAAEQDLPQALTLEAEGSDLSREAQLVTSKHIFPLRFIPKKSVPWTSPLKREPRKRRSSAPESSVAPGLQQPRSTFAGVPYSQQLSLHPAFAHLS